jgi:thiosulfate dehydrogenase [quinone] large subunit
MRPDFRRVGWQLMPLRLFLGITFVLAALQKFANPAYLDPSSPTSVVAQMRSLQHSSPIGPLLGLSLHAPSLVGILIAAGELAVGIGTLIGLWTRLAGLGGLLLSLTFFLTVSWNTTPYYYGSDIVFCFAWTALIGVGDGGVLSVSAALRDRVARGRAADQDRRQFLLNARWAGATAVVAAAGAGIAATLGRIVGGTSSGAPPQAAAASPSSTPTPHRHHRHRPPTPPGTVIAKTSQVPVGGARGFRDPATGRPAYLVHPAADTFAAFSAVCTHAGCTVGFDAATRAFVCPCHGGTYSAATGQVLAGPPPAPLPHIPVHVTGDEVSVPS